MRTWETFIVKRSAKRALCSLLGTGISCLVLVSFVAIFALLNYQQCDVACTQLYDPVCGEDGRTYVNECVMRACSGNTRISRRGTCVAPSMDVDPCSRVCEDFAPVCDVNARTWNSTCHLHVHDCRLGTHTKVLHRGRCTCTSISCASSQQCLEETSGPRCVCPECAHVHGKVCTRSGHTFESSCHVTRHNCLHGTTFEIVPCSPCASIACDFHANCDENTASCVCPRACDTTFIPVCGSNNVTYNNECELRAMSCRSRVRIYVAFNGTCEVTCPLACPALHAPVCANDGITYHNECAMRESACKRKLELRALFYGACDDDDASGDGACDCHLKCARCSCDACTPQRTCSSDGREHASTCEFARYKCLNDVHVVPCECVACNKRGTVACVNGTCQCKTGVGGVTCDRCSAGFWGLHLHNGCAPCKCHVIGSARADCEQNTGRCVCRVGIEGDKCDTCESRAQTLTVKGCV